MQIERFSIKTPTFIILIMLGLVSIFLLFVTSLYFREAALNSQSRSLSRVMEVAVQEVVRQLHERVFAMGNSFQGRAEFRSALEQLRREGSNQELRVALDDPLVNGFAGVAEVDLVKLRVYDLDLALIAQSDAGIRGLPSNMPPPLQNLASRRRGVERLKALDAFWISPEGPLYSVLVPVGGLKLSAYLEVVVNPAFNLASVASMTRMPVSIYSASGKLLQQSENVAAATENDKFLSVEYPLRAAGGELAYRLVGLDDVSQLNADMAYSGIRGGLAFIVLIGVTILAGLWFFTRFLFLPMHHLQNEMERTAQGDLSAKVGQHTLKEFHALGEAFNAMARRVESHIQELQRLSSMDGLTGVNNRHHFDLALQMEWQRAQRCDQNLSLLMLDIDYFKQFNDTYGHLGGDDCLRVVSALLRESVQRPADIVARYGGEEFAILLPDTQLQGAQFIAFRIAAELARMNLLHASSPLGGRVTLSIGCATCRPAPGCGPDELVALADRALYRAKAMGRDRVMSAEKDGAVVKEKEE